MAMEMEEKKPIQLEQSGKGNIKPKFWLTFILGLLFFLGPIKANGTWTIPFDVLISTIRSSAPEVVSFYCMLIIVIAAGVTILAEFQKRGILQIKYDLSYFVTSPVFLFFRVLGAVFAILIYFSIGPEILRLPETGQLVFTTTIASVAVIVPIGAVFLTLFVAFGGLEFVGVLMRPFMRPLFKLPGRSALDAVASFVGSYSVGIYVTNKMYLQGRYSLREATIISTCFSTVSIGFFAVVASTLDLLPYFPILFIATFIVSAVATMVLIRIPPLSRIPDEYKGVPKPEALLEKRSIWKQAYEVGIKQAEDSGKVAVELKNGFVDGLKLAMVILPPILSIGLTAILLANYTPIFTWVGAPMEPFLRILGIPDAGLIAPATIIGLADMFLPALMVTGAALGAKFFIAVLSLSQILFFSAVIPLLLEVDIPIKLKDLLILFLLRTLISIPIIAIIMHLIF
ncbi:YjiH family protein [Virgibacillus halodenitrificans]|uniref:YjiH family protein n=1 Tax=Virgibacillus halodenitrificans TaxID=1482 RepID=UPI00031275F6|nr:YjiH family protein [Virgibacillus halodenitrificans]